MHPESAGVLASLFIMFFFLGSFCIFLLRMGLVSGFFLVSGLFLVYVLFLVSFISIIDNNDRLGLVL